MIKDRIPPPTTDDVTPIQISVAALLPSPLSALLPSEAVVREKRQQQRKPISASNIFEWSFPLKHNYCVVRWSVN